MHFEPQQQHDRPLDILQLERPLRLVTVPDRAMEPELYPGQQVFVNRFDPRGAGYMEQRFAVELDGRTLVRRLAWMSTGIVLMPENDDFENIRLDWPGDWRPKYVNWRETGRIHPRCTAIGPLVYGYRYRKAEGGRVYEPVTYCWSN
jgi:hypothetical protein